MAARLSHTDARGRVRMVDVGSKPETAREAVASAAIRMSNRTLRAVMGTAAGPPAESRAAPTVAKGDVLATWAGLRPASFDGLPYLGQATGWDNLFLASGHFRSGLYLSPATAVVMAQTLLDESPALDLSPFRTGR